MWIRPSLSARATHTFPVGLRNSVVLIADTAWVLGQPLENELPGIAGQFDLRGYESDEGIGRGTLLGIVEHRWTLVSDMAVNVLHLAWIRELQLAFFVGAGMVVEPSDQNRDCVLSDDLRVCRSPGAEQDVLGAAEVGGGLRIHFEYGGVQPGVIAIDVGVPLTRDTEMAEGRPPIGVHFGFEQIL